MQKKFRVCIPTAGIGNRVKKISNNLNKSLISINNKASISHIIDSFPDNCEFVIPLGYKGKFVKEYLKLAHPLTKFYFVVVKNYKGKGSGLGYTLLRSKKYLQCPFIFISCDTLINSKINFRPDHNWIGYASNVLSNQYRKVELDKNYYVKKFLSKNSTKKKNCKNYIGLAGINDFKNFWRNMESNVKASTLEGEVYGIKCLKNFQIKSHRFDWYDVGNLKALRNTRKSFKNKNENYNILEKENESIWFNDDKVIKYFSDKDIIKKRLKRTLYLKGFIPKILNKKENMYSYSKFDGEIFSSIKNEKIFIKLLQHLQKFHKKKISKKNQDIFLKRCLYFYKKKTYQRLLIFYKKFNIKDNKFSINNSEKILLKELLKKVNWRNISNGLNGRFHGDLHFENILYSKKQKKFCLLDWRQDFGGSIKSGDIYYDLAKLLHGLLVSHEAVANNKYKIKEYNKRILININNKKIYKKYLKIFISWLKKNNYDVKKVRILTGLIFLNISALHHFPYSLFLYYKGKNILIDELIKKKN
tara:strand:- start:669 stop:2258 length:1590 start_codon:yes stop_codon:yes gene_type:complete